MNRKHTKEKLFNTKCEECGDKGHSLHEAYTYVNLSIQEEVFRIKITTKVCLRCGPLLVFEVPEILAGYLEEALFIAGYDLDSKELEIQRI